MPTAADVLQELESLGSEQTRKTYRRHGVTGPQYGVSYSNLYKLVKRIKVDHELTLGLWRSGNHDARVLACMIADPAQTTAKLLDDWIKEIDNYPLADAFSRYVAQTPLARARMEKWMKSSKEMTATIGWSLLGFLTMHQNELDDAFFESYLDIIERDIHTSKNRVRYTMNGAIIAIGLRNPALQARALATAAAVGKVEVDHGDTDCKTPDAAEYIRKAAARKRKKSS